MKRSWKAGIKKQAVILGIWAAAGALLTGCKAAGGSGTGNRLRPLELSSLEYTGRLELEYAEQFAVDLYQDGFQVLTVADGSRMLLVPEGKEAPEDVPEETQTVEDPDAGEEDEAPYQGGFPWGKISIWRLRRPWTCSGPWTLWIRSGFPGRMQTAGTSKRPGRP